MKPTDLLIAFVLATASSAPSAQTHDAHAMTTTQSGAVPADARDPDAHADGLVMDPMTGMDMADDARRGRVLLDRLERVDGRRTRGEALDAQAWYGTDLDRLWFAIDGERVNGRLGATWTEAAWDHAVAPYWSLQAGVRHDLGRGPVRDWAAFGVQGLAPYRFDVRATVYVGERGRTALRAEVEYDLRVTRRLVLQPDVQVDVYGRDDRRRGTTAGLSDVDAGLRLRYEFTRKFAPYIGVAWSRHRGEPATEVRAVAGLKAWF